jgi:hypothetical protein
MLLLTGAPAEQCITPDCGWLYLKQKICRVFLLEISIASGGANFQR